MSFDVSSINLWAVLVATVISVGIGALWYSPVLFGNVWMRLAGVNPEQNNTTAAGPMTGTMIITIIGTYVLAIFIHLTGASTAFEGFMVALLLSS